MINYRPATIADTAAIAQLHARSWQQFYAGIWNTAYLDGPVVEDRQQVWQERLSHSVDNQFVIVAESGGQVVGFACMYTEEDATYGTLLDNLHVLSSFQGQRIGLQLMVKMAEIAQEKAPLVPFYLWALEENHAARRFYEKLAGVNVETQELKNPDGTYSPACRYVWSNASKLITS